MSEKGKTILVYILLFVIFALVCILIGYSFLNKTDGVADKVVNDNNVSIGSECTFEMTMHEFNGIKEIVPSNFCDTLNLIKLTDVALDGKKQSVDIVYSKLEVLLDDVNTGFYTNNDRMTRYASSNFINTVGIFDNKFFILNVSKKGSNVTVFNSDMEKVFDLESVLNDENITDPAFVELAKTNTSLETTLNISNIDGSTMRFANGQFTFASNSKLGCNGYTGSTYKVTYVGDEFTAPEFVNLNSCTQ